MTTKVIAALILAIVLFGAYQLVQYSERVKNEEEQAQKQEQQAITLGDQLPGMPQALEQSFRTAKDGGAEKLGAWLKTYGSVIQDPKKAWVELDYVMLLSREHPAEARRLFASVKARVKESSPVYPRIKQLEKTYE